MVTNCPVQHHVHILVIQLLAQIRSQDGKMKRANFIDRNNDLIQEFYFSRPSTIAHINTINNSHFYGSVLWRIGSRYKEKLEKTWYVSLRRMFGLPFATHCYLIEPVSNQKHAKTPKTKKFLNFIQSIRNSKKSSLRNLLKEIEVKKNKLEVAGFEEICVSCC